MCGPGASAARTQRKPIRSCSSPRWTGQTRRQDRLLDRREKRAEFRDAGKTLDPFDFDFNGSTPINSMPPWLIEDTPSFDLPTGSTG
jgi:hypothetical protein